jgi:dihydroxyacetone kinase-like protein
MEVITRTDLGRLFHAILDQMTAHKDTLNQLDGAMGDGDLGITMTTGWGAIVRAYDANTEPDLGQVIAQMGLVMADQAPSTMGTLLATALMRSGKAVRGLTTLELGDIANMAAAAVDGIRQRGKSETGQKTILDALAPAAAALREAADQGLALQTALEQAWQAAQNGADKTRDMVARHGRGAYYGEQTLGKPDPGAVACALLFAGICKGIDAGSKQQAD